MKHLWICEHPPTLSNGLCIGQSPVPISITWDEAVEKVLESTPITPTEIWTSDLPRCHNLAKLAIARSWNLPVQVDQNLREISMGDWQGKSYDDLQAFDTKKMGRMVPRLATRHSSQRKTSPCYETESRLGYRKPHCLPNRVLIAHAGVVRTLRVLAGASWDEAMSTPVPILHGKRLGNGERMIFSVHERSAVCKAILGRRDIRMYRRSSIPTSVHRILRWSCGGICRDDATVELYCIGRLGQTNPGASPLR